MTDGQAAVDEDTIPNFFRLNFRKWWKQGNCNARASGRRMAGGDRCGRHDKENDGERGREGMIKRLEK